MISDPMKELLDKEVPSQSYESFLALFPAIKDLQLDTDIVTPIPMMFKKSEHIVIVKERILPKKPQEVLSVNVPVETVDISNSTVAFCLDSPNKLIVDNFFEDEENLYLCNNEAIADTKTEPVETSPKKEHFQEGNENVEYCNVENFELDENFDYDNVELTPKYPPEIEKKLFGR